MASEGRGILSPVRLPVPPLQQIIESKLHTSQLRYSRCGHYCGHFERRLQFLAPFGVLFQSVRRALHVCLTDDIVPVEQGPCLAPADGHCDYVRNAVRAEIRQFVRMCPSLEMHASGLTRPENQRRLDLRSSKLPIAMKGSRFTSIIRLGGQTTLRSGYVVCGGLKGRVDGDPSEPVYIVDLPSNVLIAGNRIEEKSPAALPLPIVCHLSGNGKDGFIEASGE